MSAPWPTLRAAPNVDRPPWNWNPVETYLSAYTTMQKNQREQASQEMEQILFPIKKQQAQLALEKMNLEMEKTKGEIERQRILTRQETEVTRNNNRGFNDGLANNQPNTSYGSGVSTLVQNYLSGGSPAASGGGGGTKKLGQGHTGYEDE